MAARIIEALLPIDRLVKLQATGKFYYLTKVQTVIEVSLNDQWEEMPTKSQATSNGTVSRLEHKRSSEQ